MELREFTRTDWYGFAGALGWEECEPFLSEGKFDNGMRWVLVLDKQGGCLIADDERAEFGGYMLASEFTTPEAARTFAASLGDPRSRLDFFLAGFKEI